MKQMLSDMGNMDFIIQQATKKNRKTRDEVVSSPISKAFRDAICNGGTPVCMCLCGVTYFVENGENMDEGELEKLLQQEKQNPTKYVGVKSDDSISFGLIEGQEYVWHCEFCPRVKKIETWIMDHRFLIVEFLKAREKTVAERAKMEHDLIKELQTS